MKLCLAWKLHACSYVSCCWYFSWLSLISLDAFQFIWEFHALQFILELRLSVFRVSFIAKNGLTLIVRCPVVYILWMLTLNCSIYFSVNLGHTYFCRVQVTVVKAAVMWQHHLRAHQPVEVLCLVMFPHHLYMNLSCHSIWLVVS